MKARSFYNADGEMLFVPQAGRHRFMTELGVIDAEPQEIVVVPRGMRFRLELPDGSARGYICENYGANFRLPDLGPIGSNGLANARDFLTPVAAYEDIDGPHELVAKFQGRLWTAQMDHSPLDVVAWHGNYAPYKYDLRRFNAIGSISYDHPDPSIFLVLHSASDTAGVSNIDFVIFPPRTLAMQDTFRPPWFHRNVASEFMGLVHGAYDAKAEGFSPGGASLHNSMSGHGPDVRDVREGEPCRSLEARRHQGHDGLHVRDAPRVATHRTRRRIGRVAARVLPVLARPGQTLQSEQAMNSIDETHDPALKSWVESANDPATDFSIQNLPFGRFRKAGESGALRIGVAIGDQILDLAAAGLIDTDDMNRLMAASPEDRRRLRRAISAFLRDGEVDQKARDCLVAQSDVEVGLPCQIRDYTDFYTSIHHATTVGKQFRPENPLLPNYKWVPIGYHGRASSIGVSGESFPRPNGQIKSPDSDLPTVGPTRRLDYELEIGVFIGMPNARGEAVSMEEAESRVFGMALFNDWTARDIQPWEYQPLGPFLSKNFASTLSPWIVTTEALAPFRSGFLCDRPLIHNPCPISTRRSTESPAPSTFGSRSGCRHRRCVEAGQPASVW